MLKVAASADEGGLKPFGEEALGGWEKEHGHLWLHFDFPDPDAIDWVTEHGGLDDLEDPIGELEGLDAVRERAAVTQEEVQSRLAEQQNVRMDVLSVMPAIILPLGFLTGLLGINVGGIPGAENPRAFYESIGIVAVIAVVQIINFWTKRWF